MNAHIRFPQAAIDAGVDEGRVIVQFVVTKTGKVGGDVRIVVGSFPAFNEEAVRLVKSLPDFIPGKKDDWQPVNVWYTLPVMFKRPK